MIRTTPPGGKHRPKKDTIARKSVAGAKKRGFFRRYWWVFVVIPVAIVLGLLGTIMFVYANTDIPEAPLGDQTTFVYDRHGKLVARLHSTVNRTVVPFDRMSEHVKHAVVAIEDKDFYRHGGVSYFAIVRAGWNNLVNRRIEQGGSTITQQYVKQVYTGSERTYSRKLREAILAVKLDHEFSKDEILEKYLNTVYFGNGAYGVEAAAKTYWGIPARRLDVLQSATLAGAIAAPATYDPVRHPEAAKDRRDLVLRKMAEQGYITQTEADQLQAEPVEVREREPETSKFAYFVDQVSRTLQDRYGADLTFSGGLRVQTTLDSAYQVAAEEAVADHLPGRRDPTAALVAIDPTTGEIRAMVGGKDFNKVKFNNATQAHRQTGSAFKTFALAAAMEQRISLESVWTGPSQITIDDPRCFTNGEPWEVHNYGDASAGTMSLTDATANSVNTIFAQLVVTVDPDYVVDVASRMGVDADLQPVCSIALGSQEVTPLEMADGYSTLAARGVHRTPHTITEVKTAEGEVLEELAVEERRAIARNDADLVTYALQRVVSGGTGSSARLPDGRPVAGKTGTTQDYADAWFCGYTPQLVACVWVGYRQGRVPMHDIQGFPNVYGGSIPALIWHDFMAVALTEIPAEDFPVPSFEGYDRNSEGATSPSPSPSPSPTEPSPSPTEPSPSPTEPSPSPTEPSPSPTEPSPSPSSGGPGFEGVLPDTSERYRPGPMARL